MADQIQEIPTPIAPAAPDYVQAGKARIKQLSRLASDGRAAVALVARLDAVFDAGLISFESSAN